MLQEPLGRRYPTAVVLQGIVKRLPVGKEPLDFRNLPGLPALVGDRGCEFCHLGEDLLDSDTTQDRRAGDQFRCEAGQVVLDARYLFLIDESWVFHYLTRVGQGEFWKRHGPVGVTQVVVNRGSRQFLARLGWL